VDLERAQWQALMPVLRERELLPYLDIAYQGYGDGIDEDAFAIRAGRRRASPSSSPIRSPRA
jgi:aromatic-amino-acid transaminase